MDYGTGNGVSVPSTTEDVEGVNTETNSVSVNHDDIGDSIITPASTTNPRAVSATTLTADKKEPVHDLSDSDNINNRATATEPSIIYRRKRSVFEGQNNKTSSSEGARDDADDLQLLLTIFNSTQVNAGLALLKRCNEIVPSQIIVNKGNRTKTLQVIYNLCALLNMNVRDEKRTLPKRFSNLTNILRSILKSHINKNKIEFLSGVSSAYKLSAHLKKVSDINTDTFARDIFIKKFSRERRNVNENVEFTNSGSNIDGAAANGASDGAQASINSASSGAGATINSAVAGSVPEADYLLREVPALQEGQLLCGITGFLANLLLTSSSFTVAVIAVDRFVP